MTAPLERGDRLPDRVVPPLDGAAIAAYVAMSGDDNPLHTDPELARRAGLDGVPVPGLLVMAIMAHGIEAFVSTLSPVGTVMGLRTRFVSPAYAGAELVLTGRVVALDTGAGTAVVRLVMSEGARPVAMGEATLRLAVRA